MKCNVCARVSVCVRSVCTSTPPQQGALSYLWPLQVQGWRAITKTALSITLTDRLKRGFNSHSSPWALHHRDRYPSTLPLSPFIVSSCQSCSGWAKWPPPCSRLSFGCGLERYSNSRYGLIDEPKGLARISPYLRRTGGRLWWCPRMTFVKSVILSALVSLRGLVFIGGVLVKLHYYL